MLFDLTFPANEFTLQTKTVQTLGGESTVIYRHYDHIVYVSKPLDTEYQSMNVDVPISINGTAVDPAKAPIFLAIRFGGYMPTRCGGIRDENILPPPATKENKTCSKLPPPANRDDRVLSLALAAGFVMVFPGIRGIGLRGRDGALIGKAPAPIVDLKAVVRYIRHNKGVFPGDVEHIVSNGLSAGGAMSALLAASGNSPLYEKYLKEAGAAEERDDIMAAGVFCPMCDLEHADMAYEWMYGPFPNGLSGEFVDQELSRQLAAGFPPYQASLGLLRHDNGEVLTAENYMDYLAKEYLIPSANAYLQALDEPARTAYLAEHTWLNWDGETACFTVDDLHARTGRRKSLPAFDSFILGAECAVFGDSAQEGAHFTRFAIEHTGGEGDVADLVKEQVRLMNPMYFLLEGNADYASHWWIRLGAEDNGMSLSVAGNLAAALEKRNKDVDMKFYWGAGHYTDLDPEKFIVWVTRHACKEDMYS